MKKLSVLLVAIAVAMSASAGVNVEADHAPKANKASYRADSDRPDVITEIPEGCQIYICDRNSGAIASSVFGILNTPTDGQFRVAFDYKKGEVYIFNPTWWHNIHNTWVKGSYTDSEEGTTIIIPTGQYLAWDNEERYGVQLVWGSSSVYQRGEEEDGSPAYYTETQIDERTTEIQFLLNGDNIYLLGTEGDVTAEYPEWGNATGMMTIYSNDQSWTSFEIANRDENGNELPFGHIVDIIPAGPSAVNELNAAKTVANVHYFNVAGQEMAQPEGLTIQVTTYTDGTKSAVKVVK